MEPYLHLHHPHMTLKLIDEKVDHLTEAQKKILCQSLEIIQKAIRDHSGVNALAGSLRTCELSRSFFSIETEMPLHQRTLDSYSYARFCMTSGCCCTTLPRPLDVFLASLYSLSHFMYFSLVLSFTFGMQSVLSGAFLTQQLIFLLQSGPFARGVL